MMVFFDMVEKAEQKVANVNEIWGSLTADYKQSYCLEIPISHKKV